MTDEKRTENEPHDRLTRLADRIARMGKDDPDYDDEKMIVFLHDGDRGGIGLFGYDSDSEAVADMLIYLRSILRANGKDLQVHARR